MAFAKYTICPPSVAPLLHEYDDWDNIPPEAWREYIAACAYWARCWRMYDEPPKRRRQEHKAKQSADTAATAA
jgi:hypothetical protein